MSELVDDLLELLEGPLQIRSQHAGSGGAIEGSIGAVSGSQRPIATPIEPAPLVEVVDRLEPAPVTSHCLANLTVGAGVHACVLSADHPGPHESSETTGQPAYRWDADGVQIGPPEGLIGSIPADLAGVELSPDAERLVRGDCTSPGPTFEGKRCELVAGHEGEHRRDGRSWA